MDRSLQSALEKRTRVGAWQSRVYRLERGYLSAWPDVVSAAANEQPSRTECLFQDDQVATVTDQGDRRFRLEFPWDGAKTLSLRANNAPMKKAWMDVLQATLREAKSQIQATGSVFAYGGTAQHAEDEAYEEAAYLKTNRFVAAYVVDEQSRASYVNDLLNERFHYVGERAGSEQDVFGACSGANAALEELVALTEDFKEEMLGVEELRQGHGGGGEPGQRDPSVSAPKIARFCEEYLDLVGRLVASRLMLELSPFMDSSVAGTAAAPTGSTRAELVATRRKLDEAYAATDRLVVSGTRAWFMDIRGSFLDCTGLANASYAPPPPPRPSPPPVFEAEVADKEVPNSPAEDVAAVPSLISGNTPAEHAKRSPNMLLANAFSAAKAATKGASMGSSRGKDNSNAKGLEPGQEPRTGGSGLSMRGMFRRGSRTEKEQPVAAKLVSPRKSPHRDEAEAWGGETAPSASPKNARQPETEERERSDLFGGSSRSPTPSPRPTQVSRSSPFSNPSREVARAGSAASSVLPLVSDRSSGSLPSTNSQPLAPAAGGVRKEKRAFAGGLWGSGGSATAEAAAQVADPASERAVPITSAAPAPLVADTKARAAEDETKTWGDASSRAERGEPNVSAPPAKPDASGGKRRFAGGIFSVPPSQSSSSAARSNSQASNPFGAGGSGSVSGVGPGVASSASGVTTKPHVPGREPPRTAPKPIDPKPAWATEDADDTSVPDWAAEDSGAGAARGGTAGSGNGGGQSNGFGLAPASREGQGREAAEKSVFMRVDEDIPPARRPSRRRPGESGSKRAFGGGERLF